MKELFSFAEGATPITDCSGLIPRWVHNTEDLNRVEAENIAQAQRKYLNGRVSDPKMWFNVQELKKVHRAMFGNVWEWAGNYRQSETSIGIKPALIPFRLAEFCSEVVYWSQEPIELTFVERAARIHHRLVFIHPYNNGNGCFSRLIADRFLLALKCTHPVWPSYLNQDGLDRKTYIQALKCADSGDYEPLIIFMKTFGAQDPTIEKLIKNTFYRHYIHGEQGVSLLKALLRYEDHILDKSTLLLAKKLGLEKMVTLLSDSH